MQPMDFELLWQTWPICLHQFPILCKSQIIEDIDWLENSDKFVWHYFPFFELHQGILWFLVREWETISNQIAKLESE